MDAPDPKENQNSKEVSCQYQNLSAFPSDLSPSIEKLDLTGNFLRNVTEELMVNLKSLQVLNLSYNRLEHIDLKVLELTEELLVLVLAGNQLHKNSLSNGKAVGSSRKLQALDLSKNGLDSDAATSYLGGLSSLQKLDLSDNEMTRLSTDMFSGTPNLEVINLQNNHILEIDEGTFESLRSLRVLNLAKNSLSCIAGFGLIQLHILNLSRNSINVFVADETEGKYELQVLDLSHNKLLYFPLLPKLHLQHLNLSYNEITFRVPEPLNVTGVTGVRDGYKDITRLNKPRYSFPEVTDLDLSNNHLKSFPLPFLSNLKSLEHLTLSKNCIENVSLYLPHVSPMDFVGKEHDSMSVTGMSLQSLRSLYLQENLIESWPSWFFKLFPQIEKVDMRNNIIKPCSAQDEANGLWSPSGNHLRCASFSSIPTLKYLSLHGNHLTELPPYMFYQTPLVFLDLSGNENLVMSRYALAGLEPSLEHLNLAGNQMSSASFSPPCLERLKVLVLTKNQLEDLPSPLACSPLENLDIRNNTLQGLEDRVVQGWSRTLKGMLLSGNSFNCCSSNWLRILRDAKVDVVDMDSAECFHQNENESFFASLNENLPWCPSSAVDKDKPTIIALSIIIFLLVLSSITHFIIKGYGKCHKLLKLKSNRVESAPCNVGRGQKNVDLRLSVI
nr:PREDICTED: leucine-rich repeat-containing protein 32-like [Latimeria chalumnae]|eukprot:XP_014344526.1 PREDICTED: leucine-rich repeat-containing protein 32-like [Latimeria chalumnae]